jgi:hypothetical protein
MPDEMIETFLLPKRSGSPFKRLILCAVNRFHDFRMSLSRCSSCGSPTNERDSASPRTGPSGTEHPQNAGEHQRPPRNNADLSARMIHVPHPEAGN